MLRAPGLTIYVNVGLADNATPIIPNRNSFRTLNNNATTKKQ